MEGLSWIYSLQLKPLVEKLKEVSRAFENVSFTHVYKEYNVEAKCISKEGQSLFEGTMELEVCMGK
jgi:hypothetical protein